MFSKGFCTLVYPIMVTHIYYMITLGKMWRRRQYKHTHEKPCGLVLSVMSYPTEMHLYFKKTMLVFKTVNTGIIQTSISSKMKC